MKLMSNGDVEGSPEEIAQYQRMQHSGIIPKPVPFVPFVEAPAHSIWRADDLPSVVPVTTKKKGRKLSSKHTRMKFAREVGLVMDGQFQSFHISRVSSKKSTVQLIKQAFISMGYFNTKGKPMSGPERFVMDNRDDVRLTVKHHPLVEYEKKHGSIRHG